MATKKPWYSIDSKLRARRFLTNWKKYLKEEKYPIIFEAAVASEQYLDLDSLSFLIACINCHDPLTQVAGLHALGEKLIYDPEARGIKALFQAYNEQTSPIIRGVALKSLGRIGNKHKKVKIKPLLLDVINDRKAANELRLDANIGLIYLMEKNFTGRPKFQIWRLDYQKPADKQIDWDWIKELQTQTRQNINKPNRKESLRRLIIRGRKINHHQLRAKRAANWLQSLNGVFESCNAHRQFI